MGQWPPPSRKLDTRVVSGWNKDDLSFYREATTLRNVGKGIAALPYLRRIIENHISDILQLLQDSNDRSPIPGFDSAKLVTARKSHRFQDKLDFARDYLPTDLTPKGAQNPILTLYALISDALHQRSEAECCDIFDHCKTAFEFVIKKLAEARRDDEEYIRIVKDLTKTKPLTSGS